MKKSLIALAALGAFAGAASAQSSVTLYGLVDLSYQFAKSGDVSPLRGDSLNKLADGTEYGPGSRWGLRVSEDLGSGLKANVVLESGFSADTGAGSSGGLFNRQAFVSLASATLGEVRLGRQYTLHDEVQLLNNPFGNATVLNPGAGAFGNVSVAGVGGVATASRLPLFIDAVRQNNAVQYISPSFAGFRLQAMVAAGEGSTALAGIPGVTATNPADRYQGIKATYAQGPLNVALAYEQSDAGAANVNKIASLGANYDFGVVKVFAGYQQGKDLVNDVGTQVGFTVPGVGGPQFVATKLKAATVGASVPFGAFTVGANYILAKYEDTAGVFDRDLGKAGVVATYSLSKLTTVYAGYAQAVGDLKDAINEKQVFQLGLRKAF